MHCTSTTMASHAPVRTTFSCVRKLLIGMPWRMATSFAVQQTPQMLMPFRADALGKRDHFGSLA